MCHLTLRSHSLEVHQFVTEAAQTTKLYFCQMPDIINIYMYMIICTVFVMANIYQNTLTNIFLFVFQNPVRTAQ